MSDFMGRNLLNETGEICVDVAEEHPALRRVDVRGNWKINQVRPGLSEIEIRLLSDVDIVEGRPAEIKRAYLHLRTRLIQRVFGHGGGRHAAQRAVLRSA